MINALKRVPINGMNKKLFIKSFSTTTVSPILFSSSQSLSSTSKILPTFSKSNFLENNIKNFNKRFFSTENNNNNSNNNNNVDTDINTPISDFSSTASSSSASTTTTEVITDTISNKVLPSYILKPTMGPDAFTITEWSHQFNFDLIAKLNELHVQYGLPWVSIFVGTAIAIRVLTLPLAIRNQRDAAKMRLVKQDMEKHSYLNDGTQEGRIKIAELQKKSFAKHDTSPMKTLGLNMLQMPFIIYPFIFLRQLSGDTNLLVDAGALWFKNLSMADPYYILPLVSSIFQYGSVRFSMTDDTSPMMKTIMTSFCFLPLVFTIHFAASLNIYWAVNSMIFAFTNWFLKSERGCKLFNIPYFKKVDKVKQIIEAPTIDFKNKPAETANSEQEKKDKLLKELQDRYDLLDKKKQEIKLFGRKNK
ncbi:hypothetical protein DDB_G0281171 [Dictyostelium discoideum AX4]|uniref:Membrane insertase YidC/Oxa/ALB C-terminal domain-containing protein n=1 Tax=Dictyostelium discoideum TaxID=44689 RepID=Q54UB7_DICDI|nr:hypothetical protein DDB_G0281171 [Dictyostelium discoideum AX4]EAL66882.2 hypothetical protein DDB_G0281171 [Dictyostelium discoideum AX4]|eukprot:XP_640859.2 hypothetical protein DDB_G0281171 [Dictyostelium discoideum AX4]